MQVSEFMLARFPWLLSSGCLVQNGAPHFIRLIPTASVCGAGVCHVHGGCGDDSGAQFYLFTLSGSGGAWFNDPDLSAVF